MLRSESTRQEAEHWDRDVVLVFPPPWVPFQPYASLPYLAGALREAGISYECLDASLEFYEHFLRPDRLAECYDRYREAERVPQRLRRSSVPDLFADHVIESCGRVAQTFRGEDFFDPDQRSLALRLLRRSLDLVASAYQGCRLGLDHASGPWSNRSSSALVDNVLHAPETPFHDLFEVRILPRILRRCPRVVGISVVFADQAFPGLLLARRVRELLPEARIVLGGPFFTANCSALERPGHPILSDLADYVLVGEGETAFVELVRTLLEGAEVPKGLPTVECVIRGQLENLAALPRPAYEALPLDQYFAPESVLTVVTSRGCYWNRCEFCDIPGIGERGFYRTAGAGRVATLTDELHESTGARCFAFWDDAVPPKTLKALAHILSAEGRRYFWYAQTRADDVFDAPTCASLYAAGCRQLYVGLETGSPELEKSMNKGLELDRARRVARKLADAGIVVSAGFFFGFPGETAADIETTLRFMVDNADVLYPSSANVGAFSLRKGSPIHRRRHETGIRVIEPGDHDLALDLAFELEDPAPFDRFELAANVRHFLEDRGFDEDRFGPHYLLYQVVEGRSRPAFRPRSDLGELSSFSPAPGTRWMETVVNGAEVLTLYVPTTAVLLRLDCSWLPWLKGETEPGRPRVRGFLERQDTRWLERLAATGLLVSQSPGDSVSEKLEPGAAIFSGFASRSV